MPREIDVGTAGNVLSCEQFVNAVNAAQKKVDDLNNEIKSIDRELAGPDLSISAKKVLNKERIIAVKELVKAKPAVAAAQKALEKCLKGPPLPGTGLT